VIPLYRSALLEQRIKEYNIPAIPGQVSFDRILVYMLKIEENNTIKGSTLFIPEEYSKKGKKTNRGIIVNAGPLALDILRSNGMELGDIVLTPRYGEWTHTVEQSLNTETNSVEEVSFQLARVCDVAWDEDQLKRQEAGELVLESRDGKHQFSVNRVDLNDTFANNE
jgi:hypothetical protein